MRWNHFTIYKTRRTRSFSLVEALLAMTILGISVTSLMTTFSSALLVGKLSEEYSIAASLMGELHTQLRANLLSPLDINEGTFTLHPRFAWQVNYLYTDLPNLYEVELVILWTRGNRQQALRHRTYHYYEIPGASSTESETERT
ncbi:MAG TPA: type II secretion system protein [bacterium]|nr:type II secretion system protein [Candidatus Omnitrophota bacterium]HOJ61229.1 type II secretion system protein [bacterium]HOL94176.1 type II secretion system protein [bacterium]HPP00082.1 type II secretion system protein [bacterium]HXK94991.1 type II secretion system protein [bacterium]